MASRKQAGSVVEAGSSHVAETGTRNQEEQLQESEKVQHFRESMLKLFSGSERKREKVVKKKKVT